MNQPTKWRHKLELEHKKKYLLCEKFCSELAKQLEEILSQENISTAFPIEFRAKSWESIYENCERRKISPQCLDEIEDFAGLRIILLFIRDLEKSCTLIEENFKIFKKENISKHLKEDKFGYSSIHYILTPPSGWFNLPSLKDLKGLKAEVQVRTGSQHIWAAASHILQYKREKDVPSPLQRSINRVAALLELVDLEFERVLSERGQYIETIKEATDETLNTDSLRRKLNKILPKNNLTSFEDYSNLLGDLRAFEVNSIKQLESITKKHLDTVLELEAKITNDIKKSKAKVPLQQQESIQKGVLFTHTGLIRKVMECEFGEKFNIFRATKYDAMIDY